MSSAPEQERPQPAAGPRKPLTAGIVITVLGGVLLARNIYDSLTGSNRSGEMFMLGVSGLIVLLGLYMLCGSSPGRRRRDKSESP